MRQLTGTLILLLIATMSFAQSVDFERQAPLMPELYMINGTAFLEELSNGDLQLRLSDNFSTPAGPDVRILLNDAVSGSGGTEIVNLSTIGHFSGGLTVDVPSSVAIDDYDYIVFFCVNFGQLWASGEFGPVVNLGSSPVCEDSDVENANGPNSVDICPTDGNSDFIDFENTLGLDAGNEYAYLITDDNEVLQTVITNADGYDFEGSSFDEQRVYGVHYFGALNPVIGQDRMNTTASECYEHSSSTDFITVTKGSCPVCDMSDVFTITGDNEVDICPSDGNSDIVLFDNSLGLLAGSEYVYLITDDNEDLQDVVFDDFFDFEGSTDDEQRVYVCTTMAHLIFQ